MADEYVDGNEPPISRSSSDSDSGSSEDQSDDAKPMVQGDSSKMPETANSEAQRDENTRIDDLFVGSREYFISFKFIIMVLRLFICLRICFYFSTLVPLYYSQFPG
jgi:hypothetical protein